MDLDLTGKRALVTGSTRGIGLAIAKGLAGMGAEVIISGRTEEAVAQAREAIQAVVPGATTHGMAADLGTAAGCTATTDAFSEVDILVNNMGIYKPKAFFDITDEDWEEMFYVNVMSGARLTRHYLKPMVEKNGWGRVVFISSESGVFIPKEMVHYGFSKGAQLTIARGAAEYTKGTNVTVNSVQPGPTLVEGSAERFATRAKEMGVTPEVFVEKFFNERRPTHLLQRFAEADEVANMVCYVCSKASSATNGATLRVDGGIVSNPF